MAVISALRSYLNALPSGLRIHWYDIEQVIGQGAFGITYVANDVNLSRKVAIKEYMPAQLATRTGTQRAEPISTEAEEKYQWGKTRFLDEARILADIEHPNIVRVLSVFEANNTAYMVMQYERGESLDSILKRHGSLDEAQVLEILYPMMDGLEFIHGRRIIHRDIKPGNIYIREDGPPVLLDFGSARRSLESRTARLTSLVTPGYAPIEQYGARADKQGPWTDIYGLGATLYRTMSGEPPPDAINRSESIATESRDTYCPQHREIRHRYSEAMLAAVNGALQFSPHDRPQSIPVWRGSFAEEIRDTVNKNNDLFSVRTLTNSETLRASAAGVDVDHESSTKMPPVNHAPSPRNRPVFAIAAGISGTIIATGLLIFGGDFRTSVSEQAAVLGDSLFISNIDTLVPNGLDTSPFDLADNPDGGLPLIAGEEPDPFKDIEEQLSATMLAGVGGPLEELSKLGDSNGEDVSTILDAAERDVRALRLTRPAGSNALEKFRLVLLLEPNNSRALEGIESIVDRYAGLVDSLVSQNRFEEAEVLIDRARGISPIHEAIDRAEHRLDLSRFEFVISNIASGSAADSELRRLASVDRKRKTTKRAEDFVRQIGGDLGEPNRSD